HERLATGTHDTLKARAFVFRGDKVQAAVVSCDLTAISSDLTKEVRRHASARTGIPTENIILTATHSHTAPDYMRDLYDYLGSSEKKANADQRYAVKLVDGIVGAIATAHSRAEPALIDTGSTRQEIPVSFNRRFLMRDGSVRTWMSFDNPD